MTKAQYFKSSLVVAASGLAANVSHAQLVTETYNYTFPSTSASPYGFDVNGDSTPDYNICFANGSSLKPQIFATGGPGGSGGVGTGTDNEVFLNSAAGDDHNTLPVLTSGTVVNAALATTLGGVLNDQGFFYQNYNNNYWGNWAGSGGATAPGTPVGPITGYVGLALPAVGGGYNYGYAEFTVDMTQSLPTFELLNTVYDSVANEAVTIAPVPEPTSVALLAAGAAGLLTLRRRSLR